MRSAQLIDGYYFVRGLRPSRIWHAALLLGSYYLSKWTGRNMHRGLPVAISIEPTTSCNLRCPECPSGLRSFTRPTGMLQPELNRMLIEQLRSSLTYITYYFQGEPYLNPVFLDMVSQATKHGIYTATSTNAHYLTDEICERTIQSGLKRLVISIDGVDQESYAKYRVGGKLDKVIEGTRNLLEWKRRTGKRYPYVIWQFIVFKHNEHQIPEIRQLAKQIGVDKLAIKTAQLYGFEDKENLLPSPTYSRYEKGADGVQIRNPLLNHCWRMWHACVVTWDGKVSPCCFDKDASHPLGDVNTESFLAIWGGARYRQFRNTILKSRSGIEICRNCTEGTKVWS